MAYVKTLSNGDYALGFFNFGDTAGEMSLQFWDIGLPTASGLGLSLRNLWKHEDLGTFKESYTIKLEAHACAVFKAKVVRL
jgi:alpha-galactosidase